MKIIGGFVLVVVVAVGGWWFLGRGGGEDKTPSAGAVLPRTLAPEVEVILEKEMKLLADAVRVTSIVSSVSASNEKNKNLSQAEIDKLDGEWQAADTVTPFIDQFLKNSTAVELRVFQKANPEFKEVFIADAKGLVVGETEKTSDYYQADESWWVESFDQGRGKSLHGEIEFDESAQSEAISIYVPVVDPVLKRAIGVAKGVIDLAAIKENL